MPTSWRWTDVTEATVAEPAPWGVHPDQADELVIVDDGGSTRLDGPAFGPAGAIVVDLGDGSEWWVDHADPDHFVLYEPGAAWRTGADLAAEPAVAALFGGDAALMLADRWDRRSVMDPDGAYPVGGRGPTMRTAPRGIPQGSVGDGLLRIDLASDPGSSPLARLATAAEALTLLGELPVGSLLDHGRAALIGGVLDDAAVVDSSDVAGLDPRLVRPLADELQRALVVEPDLRSALEGVIGRLRRFTVEPEMPVALPVMADAVPMAAGEPEEPGELGRAFALAVPDGSGRQEPWVTSETQALVVVRVGTDIEPGGWASVWRADGLVRIGLAPLQPDLDGWSARIAVPPDLVDGAEIARIEHPDRSDGAGSASLASVRGAVQAGRDACRHERLGDRDAARARWLECAGLWRAVGDVGRALLATTYAERFGPAARRRPSLADAIILTVL